MLDSEYAEMLTAAESIYEGTWGSGAPPQELVDFELMRQDGMGWSWQELQSTPRYVVRYCWDLLQARRQAEQDVNERATAEAKRA